LFSAASSGRQRAGRGKRHADEMEGSPEEGLLEGRLEDEPMIYRDDSEQ